MIRKLLYTAALTLTCYMMKRLLWRRLVGGRRPISPGAHVLVTGGGSGIGLALAEGFARRGCHLTLVGRTIDTLRDACSRCLQAGAASAEPLVLDITDRPAVAAAALPPRLDYIVLNAGQGAIHPFDTSDNSYDICERLIALNYLANVHLIQRFMAMRDARPDAPGRGGVLMISSLAGVLPSAHRAAYTASKHALQGFANVLRQERPDLQVTVVCPGFVQTGFHDRVLTTAPAAAPGSGPLAKPATARPGSMTAEQVASHAIEALEENRAELIMTLAGWLGYRLRPWLPLFIDDIAKRKALKSIGKD